MNAGSVVCLNGNFVPAGEARIPVGDHGVLFGMGLFETIRVEGGGPRLLDRHMARLFSSAGQLGLEVPFSRDEIVLMVRRTAFENSMTRGGLRVTLTAGGDMCSPTLFITARTNPYTERQYREGIPAGLSPVRRNERSPLAGHKTINYFENILARRQAARQGLDEAFLLNTSGNLAEGSVSNIFLVDLGKVVTPDPGSGLLPGIMRGMVIEICRSLGIEAGERPVSPGELRQAGECFVTNALMGVMPVTLVDGNPVGDGKPGPVTRLIMAAVDQEVNR